MSNRTETELSQEGVPLADQEAAAEAANEDTPEAELELHEVGPDEMGEERRLTEEEAEQQAKIIEEVVLEPKNVPGDRLQDHIAFANARRDEAVAQGVVKTTQEALAEIAREEEAQSQGVDHISDTTQKTLFRESRAEEIRAEKLEQAQHGAVEPVTIATDGIDQLAENERLATESELDRRTTEEKDAEIQAANKKQSRPKRAKPKTSAKSQ